MAEKSFNPIRTARKIEESYRDYISTTIHFEDDGLQAQLLDIIGRRNFLAKGPFLEATPPYTKDRSVRELVEEGVLCRGMLNLGGFDPDRKLYTHQVNAIRRGKAGKNYIVVTGTGSGKTECFLFPIINDILEEFAKSGHKPGVRAMVLYPMNALANDQLKRLRSLLEGTDITFGRYTGDTEERQADAVTKWSEENPGATRIPNEIISREQIRRTPPNILLTNYSMLEYLLLRPQDAPLFQGAFGSSWRHIAIDEAHIYSGALGTEIAYLLRRLKARIRSDAEARLDLHCYATSATIGSPEDMPKVARFAQDLFGEPFEQGESAPSVITSTQDLPEDDLEETAWGSLPLELWPKLAKSFASDRSGAAAFDLIGNFVPQPQLEMASQFQSERLALGKVLLGEESTQLLVKRVGSSLLDLTDLSSIEEIGIRGLCGDDEGVDILTAMVEVLSSAERSPGVPILASRYHSFLRAPEGIYINLAEKKLIAERTSQIERADGNSTPVYEVSVCRHCGQAYILGAEKNDDDVAWLDPKHAGSNADDDFLPRDYYRIAYGGIEETSEDCERAVDEPTIEWLCPICGSLHDREEGGAHRFMHEEAPRVPLDHGTATEENSQCSHCGYQNKFAIQPMRISPEMAGEVVCYELARQVPPFEREESDEEDLFAEFDEEAGARRPGSIICFSDRRQDAAFFAPAMDRSYSRITARQLIREAVDELDDPQEKCAPSDVARWISSNGLKRHPISSEEVNSRLAKQNQAWAWVVDELMAEDSRNSLEGLGVVRVEPTVILEYLNGPFSRTLPKTISKIGGSPSWIKSEDYVILLRMCLDTLRERGAIDIPEGADSFRTGKVRTRQVVKGDDSESDANKYILFVGSTNRTENKRSKLVRKYASQVYGVELTREDVREILRNIYGFLFDLLKAIEKKESCTLVSGDKTCFLLSPDVWRFIPHSLSDDVFICDTCGCEYHYDTHGVCLSNNCAGTTHRTTFGAAANIDEYYKDAYLDEPLPLRIEEHTAQLSSERARSIQKDFIDGKVHVLSCTTTFELGVDVGDLRAIFMRNVPPSTANYTQRSGRTGRRAGMPGYAITFARLRPHDIAFFKSPESIIKGKTKPPMCYLDNSIIALRHVFAIALSQYFRDTISDGGDNLTKKFNDFLDLEKAVPDGLPRLANYLRSHPVAIERQLEDVFSSCGDAGDRIGIPEWSWIDELVDSENGRLTKAHAVKHSDCARLSLAVEEHRESNLAYAQALERSKASLKKEGTINVLAENGVLPKYGFPTDLVELQLNDQKNSGKANSLELQRGLRLAIREYAPGAEIVAGKRLWRSTGIRRMRGRELEVRAYGKCPQCENFIWAMDTGDGKGEKCPICKSEVSFARKMLVPAYGFTGDRVDRSVGLQRPRQQGTSKIFFTQRWPEEYTSGTVRFGNAALNTKFASNAQLCALNQGPGGGGFNVCMSCGAASVGRVTHAKYCSNKKPSHFNALGTAFMSDVLELEFDLRAGVSFDGSEWKSLLWALLAAASSILEIPESEIGATLYFNVAGKASIMLFDDVPGGAGHAMQLSEDVPQLFDTAFKIVSECLCDVNTCCYGCLCNYYNQGEQHELSRAGALKILEELDSRYKLPL